MVPYRDMYDRRCHYRFIPKALRRLSAKNENSNRGGKEDWNLPIQENCCYSDWGYPTTHSRLQCGSEAGMVGVIIALGCWVNDNIKFAQKNANLYSKVGMAVSLSALFSSPLFGFFSAVENEDMPVMGNRENTDSDLNLLTCGISIVSSRGILTLFNHLFGKVLEGFPSFGTVQPDKWDLAMIIIYMICGIILGLFFEKSEKWFEKLYIKTPSVIGELLAGLVLGLIEKMEVTIAGDYSAFENMGNKGFSLE